MRDPHPGAKNAVLPLMLVCVIADAIAMRYLPNSIMTEKLARRGLNTDQEYEWNDGRNHQPHKPHANAAKQHKSLASNELKSSLRMRS